jgi:hypothetical protein
MQLNLTKYINKYTVAINEKQKKKKKNKKKVLKENKKI